MEGLATRKKKQKVTKMYRRLVHTSNHGSETHRHDEKLEKKVGETRGHNRRRALV